MKCKHCGRLLRAIDRPFGQHVWCYPPPVLPHPDAAEEARFQLAEDLRYWAAERLKGIKR